MTFVSNIRPDKSKPGATANAVALQLVENRLAAEQRLTHAMLPDGSILSGGAEVLELAEQARQQARRRTAPVVPTANEVPVVCPSMFPTPAPADPDAPLALPTWNFDRPSKPDPEAATPAGDAEEPLVLPSMF